MDDDPADEILSATYRALCEHGYADLTVQNIAAESEKSKATIHYHYGSKDELFVAFLDFLYERFTARLDAAAGRTSRERLVSLLDALIADRDARPADELDAAMLAVTAQAPYDDAVRDRIAEFDRFLFERIREVIEAGMRSGEFDDGIDPSVTAELLTTTISGAHARRTATGHSADQLSDALGRIVEMHLLAPATPERSR